MKKRNKKILLFVFISIFMPLLLHAQQNPGDVWLVVPRGIQINEEIQIEVNANSGDRKIAAYSFSVAYDPRYLYYNDAEEGPDGYMSAVSTTMDGRILLSGFDTQGTGPGGDLHFIILYFIAQAAGPSLLTVDAQQLVDVDTNDVGTPKGINACITIASNGIAGDANQSGGISIVDALLVAQYYTYATLSVAIDTGVTDVNQDGNTDIIDALLIARYYVGLIGPLPITGTPGPPVPTGTPDGTPTPTPQVIYFPDPELEAAIRYDLMIPAGENIYLYDVENVDYLYLNYDSISDLTGLEYFTSLTRFYCRNNYLTDITPLAQLTTLTTLDLQDNDISNISPLSQLTNLTTLMLSGNSISDIGPLSQLINLSRLDVNKNTISDITPLSQLTNLSVLNLSSNGFVDISPLASLVQLTDLRLYNNNISDLGPLDSLVNLEYLSLSNNLISDLTPLSGLTNLTNLYLDDNNITDVTPLFGLTQLSRLYLRDNPLTQEDIDALEAALPDASITF